jgi:hypothetical protein
LAAQALPKDQRCRVRNKGGPLLELLDVTADALAATWDQRAEVAVDGGSAVEAISG